MRNAFATLYRHRSAVVHPTNKGLRVRLPLLHDIIEAADVFLQDEVIDCSLNEKHQGQRIKQFEGRAILTRIGQGFQQPHDVVMLARGKWTAILNSNVNEA